MIYKMNGIAIASEPVKCPRCLLPLMSFSSVRVYLNANGGKLHARLKHHILTSGLP